VSCRVGVGFSSLSRGRHRDGIALYTAQLARALQPEVEVVPCLYAGEALPDGQAAGCVGYSFRAHVVRSQLGLDSYPASEQARIDLFHSTDHCIPRLSKVPCVASIFDAVPFLQPEWTRTRRRRLKNWLMRRSASWPQRVICASNHAAREVELFWGVPEEKIRVVPLAVDTGRFELADAQVRSVRFEFALPPRYVLFVGTLQPRKNLRRLVLAHQQLPEELRREVPLVVVGGDGWSSASDLAFIAKDPHVIRLGYVAGDALAALYKGADALLIPSLHEGFGLPVLEGFAARVPVACSATTALGEISQGAAVQFDPLSVADMAAALRRVIEDRDTRLRCIDQGVKLLRQYSWSRTARETIRVYQELI
jgi:alpha-1,3-rhamnosyl/mannosyltransferase